MLSEPTTRARQAILTEQDLLAVGDGLYSATNITLIPLIAALRAHQPATATGTMVAKRRSGDCR